MPRAELFPLHLAVDQGLGGRGAGMGAGNRLGKEEEHIHPDDDKSETCKEPNTGKGAVHMEKEAVTELLRARDKRLRLTRRLPSWSP